MRILGLDPGEVTGVAVFDMPEGQIRPRLDLSKYVLLASQCAFHFDFKALIDEYKPDVIVFEQFRLYPHKASVLAGSSLEPVQVIGILKYIAHEYSIPMFCTSAANAKKCYTDSKLKEHNLWVTGKQHTRDAIRHVLYYVDFGSGKESLFWYQK